MSETTVHQREQTHMEINSANLSRSIEQTEAKLERLKSKFKQHKQTHTGDSKGKKISTCHKCLGYDSMIRMTRYELSDLKRERSKLRNN